MMKKWIPLWAKCTVAVLWHQIGRLPLRIVLTNAYWSFTQNRKSSEATKEKVYKKVQKTVCDYLSKRYSSCIDEALSHYSQGVQTEPAPIWVFWWQGIQEAPYIIKTCIANVQKNAGDHPVRVIDSNNYKSFVQIPTHIEQKLQEGKISITHFSDYLRMKLLKEHGGIWMDATIFVQKSLDDCMFNVPIWTVRNPGLDTSNISNWEWSINCIGGWKGNTLFGTIEEVLSHYWAEHEMVADYFMTDCLVRVIYEKCENVRKLLDALPPSNAHFYYFQEQFNLPLDSQSYERELSSETWLYKISWKGQYELKGSDGSDTFYAQWQKDFGSTL